MQVIVPHVRASPASHNQIRGSEISNNKLFFPLWNQDSDKHDAWCEDSWAAGHKFAKCMNGDVKNFAFIFQFNLRNGFEVYFYKNVTFVLSIHRLLHLRLDVRNSKEEQTATALRQCYIHRHLQKEPRRILALQFRVGSFLFISEFPTDTRDCTLTPLTPWHSLRNEQFFQQHFLFWLRSSCLKL